MKSQTDMLEALGGIPVAMAYGDVYTSLQTGIIDGTENNETALTTGKHGEICKNFSLDEHAMIPDVLVMSAKVWETITPEDQEIILEAARESTDDHKLAWGVSISALFMAGYVPGILMGLGTMAVAFIYAKKHKYPTSGKVSMNEAVRTTLDAIPSLMLIVIVIGGIVGGIFTATEGAGICVLYCLILMAVTYIPVLSLGVPSLMGLL